MYKFKYFYFKLGKLYLIIFRIKVAVNVRIVWNFSHVRRALISRVVEKLVSLQYVTVFFNHFGTICGR